VLAPSGDWEHSPLRLRFINAGFRRDDARLIYFGAKTVLPLLFASGAWLLLRAFTSDGRDDGAMFDDRRAGRLLCAEPGAVAGCCANASATSSSTSPMPPT
jgi:hypothetical protein